MRKPSSTANQTAHRHAAEYRQRARELIDRAWNIPGEGDRRHMLDLAATYERTADALAPVLALCVGAPDDPSSPLFAEEAADYLLAREIPVAFRYVNTPGRTAAEIRRAVDRHRALALFAMASQDKPVTELRRSFTRAFDADAESAP